MIRLFACLDDEPRSEVVAASLIVILRTYEQLGIDLNHIAAYFLKVNRFKDTASQD
jgi:hypothetical protein